jgi:SAM-dependent methyltransferase
MCDDGVLVATSPATFAAGASQPGTPKASVEVPEEEMVRAYRQFAGAFTGLRNLAYTLVTRFPQDPQARFFLADVLKAGGQDDVACEHYRALLQVVLPNERRRVDQAIKQCEVERDYFPPTFAAYLASDEQGVGLNAQTWRDYAARDVQRGREIVRTLRQRSALRGKRVLDVGCGHGGMLIALAEQGAEAVGIEIDASRSRVGEQRLRDLGLQVDWRQGDIGDREFTGRLGTFDVVVCQDVLEHVLDTSQAIATLCSLLRKGGWLFMQVPNKYSPEFILADHHYALFGISLLSRPQAIEYWQLAYGAPPECYSVGYLRSEKYYRQAFAREGVTLEPTEHYLAVGHVLGYAPQMSSLAGRLSQDVYPGLRPELQRRIQNRAKKVAKLFIHASHMLRTLETNPAQLEKACDMVVRRLCRSVWGFLGIKAS